MTTYTKESLLAVVDNYDGDNAEWLEAIRQIKQTLQPFDDKTVIGKLKSADEFVARRGYSVSRLDPPQVVTDNLTRIYNQLLEWAKKCSREYKESAVEAMDKNSKILLNVFLGIVGSLAVIAVVLTVLQLIFGEDFAGGWIGKLAGACGTLDFALGALGFIVERKDDMSKRQTCSEIDRKIENGEISDAINISIKAGAKSTIVIGDGNIVAQNVVNIGSFYQK